MERHLYFRSTATFIVFCLAVIVVLLSLALQRLLNSESYALDSSETTNIASNGITDTAAVLYSDSIYYIPRVNHSPVRVVVRRTKSIPYRGTLLLLHGWNHKPENWFEDMQFVQYAQRRGFDLVMPDLGKSMYAEHVFPESRQDLASAPTRMWMNAEMIPSIQHQILRDSSERFSVIGISTGAKGAVLLAEDHPQLYLAVVAISGDYNPAATTNDRLMNLYYGPHYAFRSRWLNEDNAYAGIHQLSMPVYLMHGVADNVVDYKHSKDLFQKMRSLGFHHVQYKEDPTGKHDFASWDRYSNDILDFLSGLGR